MNRHTLLSASTCLAAFALLLSSASASTYGTNITISDQNYAGSDWYSNREDQETETNPNTITGQVWDMEGMFLSGSTLTLVGGFDFKNGTNSGGYNFKTGDIFIDVDGDAKYGPANAGSGAIAWGDGPHTAITDNTFGYDYVIHLDMANDTYDVYSLSALSQVVRVLDVETSNPWTYSSGGTALQGYQNLAFNYISGLSNADTGFEGDDTNFTGYSTGSNAHYALQVDLGFIAGQTATFHYTMECGNDNLMGQSVTTTTHKTPDSGSTVLLFGMALLGFAGIRRKFGR